MNDFKPLNRAMLSEDGYHILNVESAYKGMREDLIVKLAFYQKQEDSAILEDSYENAERYNKCKFVCHQTIDLLDMWFGAAFK